MYKKFNKKQQKPKLSLNKIYLEKKVSMMMGKKMGYGNIGIKKVLKKKK